MDTSSVATNEEDGARKQIERQSYWHSLKKAINQIRYQPKLFQMVFQGELSMAYWLHFYRYYKSYS